MLLGISAAYGIETYSPEALEVFSHEYLNSLKWETEEVTNLSIETGKKSTAVPVKVMRVSTDSYDEYDPEKRYMVVTITEPGSLNKVIYNRVDDLDSLVVKGKINKKDLNIIRICSLYGTLQVLNLEGAEVEGNTIPTDAFWNKSEQWLYASSGGALLRALNLRRVILPNSIKGIGLRAFNYAIYLEEINIPSACTDIYAEAFAYCKDMKFEKLMIPEGTTRIYSHAFNGCQSIEEVVLPSTVKNIESGAFINSNIKKINFPETLESIGSSAFSGCDLSEVRIPEACKDLGDDDTFSLNPNLSKINIPNGVKAVPDAFVSTCPNLVEIEIPSTITKIGKYAFFRCYSLKSVNIPEGTRSIGNYAFYECKSLPELRLPESLEEIGISVFEYLANVEAIYSQAYLPPVCHENIPIFGPNNGVHIQNMTSKDIPVYVHMGCKNYYEFSPAWSYFTNYIEIEDFTGAVEEVTGDEYNVDKTYYNLQEIRITNPEKNSIVICNGKKTVFK